MIPIPTFANPFASVSDNVTRFYLVPEEGSQFDFQYNPSSFSIDWSVSWEDSKTMKEPYGVLHFTGGGSDTCSFSTLLDCSEEKEETLLYEIEDLYDLTKVQIEQSDSSFRPPIVTLHWSELTFVGVITSLKVDFQMFSEAGDPVRAEITVTMTGRAFSTDDSPTAFFAPAGSG